MPGCWRKPSAPGTPSLLITVRRWSQFRSPCRSPRRRSPVPRADSAAGPGGVVGSHRLSLAEALRRDRTRRHSLLRQVVAHGLAALFGELLVVVIAADAVRVAFDVQLQARDVRRRCRPPWPASRAPAGRSENLPVSKSTSDMFTIKPRAVSRVCRMALNCSATGSAVPPSPSPAAPSAWQRVEFGLAGRPLLRRSRVSADPPRHAAAAIRASFSSFSGRDRLRLLRTRCASARHCAARFEHRFRASRDQHRGALRLCDPSRASSARIRPAP